MGHPTTKPRPLEPEELIPVLQREHDEQESRIAELADSLAREDYARTSELLERLSDPLTQHIADKGQRIVKQPSIWETEILVLEKPAQDQAAEEVFPVALKTRQQASKR